MATQKRIIKIQVDNLRTRLATSEPREKNIYTTAEAVRELSAEILRLSDERDYALLDICCGHSPLPHEAMDLAMVAAGRAVCIPTLRDDNTFRRTIRMHLPGAAVLHLAKVKAQMAWEHPGFLPRFATGSDDNPNNGYNHPLQILDPPSNMDHG